MRILLTGDWQTQTSSINLSEQALEKEEKIIKKYGIDLHIDTGDGKEDYSPVAVGVVNFQVKRARRLAKLLSKENCFRLNGNHDRIGQHSDSRNWLPVFKDNAVCIDKPSTYQRSGWVLNFLPYNKDVTDLIKQAKKLGKKTPRKSLLFFHCDVYGARYSNVQKRTSPSKFSVDEMMHNNYVQCFGGHIHKRQTIAGNVHYVGNPFPTDMGEVNQEKGFTVYDTDTNKITFISSNLPGIFTFDYLQKKDIKKIADGTQVKYVVKVLPTDDYYVLLEKAHDEITKRYPNSIPYVVPDFVEGLTKPADDAKVDASNSDLDLITQYLDIVNKDGKERPAVEAYMKYIFSTVTKRSLYAKGLVLDSVEAHNILSFKDVKFKYRNQGVCLVRGVNKDWPGHSNGSGKSNFLALLPVAHSGKTFKDQKFGDIVNDYTPDEKAWVRLKCSTYNKDKLEIYRQFNPSKLQFTVNGQDASQGMRSTGKKDTQGLIEELTGYTFDTLSNALYIDQSIQQTFLSGTDKDRADLLHKFQNLERFALAQKIANNHYSLMKRLEGDTEVASDMQTMLLKETEDRLAELSSIKVVQLSKLQKVYKKAKRALEYFELDNSERITAIKATIKELEKKVAYQEEVVDAVKDELKTASGAVSWQKKELITSITKLDRHKCSTCFQKIPHSHKKQIAATLHGKLAKLEYAVPAIEKRHKQVSEVLEKLQSKLEYFKFRYKKLSSQLEDLQDEVADTKKAYLKEQKSASLQSSIEMLKKKQTSIKYKLDSLAKLRSDQLLQMVILAKASTGFGRDGLPLFLNRLLCPRLNAAAQYYSDLFTDGEIQVLFLVENSKLIPRIVNAHGGKKLSGQSLGEKAWAGIITAFAARDVAQPTNVLILDEPGAGLDPAAAKQLGSKLSKLTDKFETLLCVTHNSYIEAALAGSNTVTVVKSNRTSKIQ